MTDQTPTQFVMIPSDEWRSVQADLAAIREALTRAEIRPAPEWITRADAADALGVSPRTVDRMAEAGRIEVKGGGKARRFRI